MRIHNGEYKTTLLDDYFTARNLYAGELQPETPERYRLEASTLFDYAHDLKRCVETYFRTYNPQDSEFDAPTRVQLERIRRLGWRTAMPLAVAFVHSKPPQHEFEMFFERLERFLFLQSLRMDRVHLHDLSAMAVRLVRREEDGAAISQKLHSFCEKTAKDIVLADTSMNVSKTRMYYGWGSLRYFLFEYEQELKVRSKSNREKLIWEDFCSEDYEADYSTIEHIYPQEARQGYWKDRFGGFTHRQRNALRNSLGNLLALSRPKNSALSNRAFPEKRDGNSELASYRMGSYSELEVAEQLDWTPQTILERGIKLLDFLGARWGIEVGSRSQKLAALRLGFMESKGTASVDDEDTLDGVDDESNDEQAN
jgi:hypothetical protein